MAFSWIPLSCHCNISPFIEFQLSKANVGKDELDMWPACRRMIGYMNNANACWAVESALLKVQLRCSGEERTRLFQLSREGSVLQI